MRYGFKVDMSGGGGSHCKITWPGNGESITIQCDLRKDVLYYLLKEINKKTGINWEEIKSKF